MSQYKHVIRPTSRRAVQDTKFNQFNDSEMKQSLPKRHAYVHLHFSPLLLVSKVIGVVLNVVFSAVKFLILDSILNNRDNF